MATPELVLAKASLSSALFRKDPVACERSEIDAFHHLLDQAVQRCSPPNVQLETTIRSGGFTLRFVPVACKRWIVKHVIPSAGRIQALARYLHQYARSLCDPPLSISSAHRPKPLARRKRLHIMYILNDVFHHPQVQDFTSLFASTLPLLFAAATALQRSMNHDERLRQLITIWENHKFITPKVAQELQNMVDAKSSSKNNNTGSTPSVKSTLKEVPFIMPSVHGDPSTPWYDLPAANWLPQLMPNSTKCMTPELIKPLHLTAGVPDPTLVDAVKTLLADVDKLYTKGGETLSDPNLDLNQMGEIVRVDKETGEVIDGQTYYGWSLNFCKKMQACRNGNDDGGDRTQSHGRQGTSRDYSSSRSRSVSYSSHSRSCSYDRSHSRIRSRSRSRHHKRSASPAFKRRRLSPSRSPSCSRRRSPYSSSQSRSHSRSDSQHSSTRQPLGNQQPPPFPMATLSNFSFPPHPPPNYPSYLPWPPPFPPPPSGVPVPLGMMNFSNNPLERPKASYEGKSGWGEEKPQHEDGPGSRHSGCDNGGGRGGGGYERG